MPVTSLLWFQFAHLSDGENTGSTGPLATGTPPISRWAVCFPSSDVVTFRDEDEEFLGGCRWV